MNQLDEGSCVLSEMESGEKVTGGEREKHLKHVNVGSSQSSSVAWDATTQRSHAQKKVSRLQGDRDQTHFDFSCKFQTTCLGFFFYSPAGFLFSAITPPGPDGDNWLFCILDLRLLAKETIRYCSGEE